MFVDPNGEETRALVGGRTERNPAGHIGLEINGTVYAAGSFYVNQGPGGDWGVPVDPYLAAQEGIRVTKILTLDITPGQEAALEESLQGRDPTTHVGLLRGSCVDVCEKALESAGILPNEPGPLVVDRAGNLMQAGAPSSITPGGVENQLERAGLVKGTQTTGTPPEVSGSVSTINGVRAVLSRPRE